MLKQYIALVLSLLCSVDILSNHTLTPLNQTMRNAILNRSIKTFKDQIKNKQTPLNIIGKSNKTLLHMAAAEGFYDAVEYLVKKENIDINATTKHGWTALHFATNICFPQMISLLIKYKIDPTIKNNDNLTACELAEENLLKKKSTYQVQMNSNFYELSLEQGLRKIIHEQLQQTTT